MEAFVSSSTSFKKQELKSKVLTVLWITLFWLLVALYQYADRYTTQATDNYIDDSYEHWPFIRGLLTSVGIASLLAGTALVFLWEKWLRNLAFIRAVSYIILWYIGLYALIIFVSVVLEFNDNPITTDQGIFKETVVTLFNLYALPNFFFWLFVLFLTLAFFLVKDKFGPRVFGSYLAGKYFRPRREERIFMFMDLKSSTTIAEKLGETKYFKFLNDAFKAATPGILATKGEIYQYVGDEIVISWNINEGLKKANCIRCFYEMTRLLDVQTEYFESTYGVTPVFKAGIHSGYVIAGEMGIIKREIVYSGDVLNTTARIQSQCNDHKVKILISKSLIKQIKKEDLTAEPRSLGELSLKGKTEKVEVVTF